MKYSGMEDPDTCTHPEDRMSPLKHDLLNRPRRMCNRCGTEFIGDDAMVFLAKVQSGEIKKEPKDGKCHK